MAYVTTSRKPRMRWVPNWAYPGLECPTSRVERWAGCGCDSREEDAMPRPRRAETVASRLVMYRATEAEAEAVEDAAKAAGESVSTWLRGAAAARLGTAVEAPGEPLEATEAEVRTELPCVFRDDPAINSDSTRPPVPTAPGHRFR